MANINAKWNELRNHFNSLNLSYPAHNGGKHHLGAASGDSESPPSLLLDYTAGDFIGYWFNKNLSLQAQSYPLQVLYECFKYLRSANPNNTLQFTSESDVIRMTQQYILNLVEPAASHLIRVTSQDLGTEEWTLQCKSEWDITSGRIDLAYSVYQKAGDTITARNILYIEFKAVNTIDAKDWRPHFFKPLGPEVKYEEWRSCKTLGDFPSSVKDDARYNMDDDDIKTDWDQQRNARSIASQLNNYFVRDPNFVGPRVPYQICFDGSKAIMFDYKGTMAWNGYSNEQKARQDKKHVGFCFIDNANVATMVPFLIAALYAGAYDATGWTF